MRLLPEEERAKNFDRFYEMQKNSLVHPGTVKGSEDNEIDSRP